MSSITVSQGQSKLLRSGIPFNWLEFLSFIILSINHDVLIVNTKLQFWILQLTLTDTGTGTDTDIEKFFSKIIKQRILLSHAIYLTH